MITLSMIVKNEGEHLKDCLLSVKDVVDEIVLVDTGSTDNTIEIAKEFGAKVYNFNWIDDFSAARNFALDHSSGDWILYLDADERLSDSSKNELKNLTRRKNECAYFCKVKSINDFNRRSSVMDYVRLFPNEKNIRFEGKIHEQIENALRNENYSIKKSNIEILHLGYNLSDENLKEKAKRNLQLLSKEFENNPSSYYAFQLGQSYGILNDKINAEKYFRISLNDTTLKNEYKSLAYRYLSVNSVEKGEWDSALSYIEKSLSADEAQPIALMVAAKIYLHFGKGGDAKYYCKKAYLINEDYLSGNRSSHQTILLDEQIIIDESINIAAKLSDKELFKFFYEKIEPDVDKVEETENHVRAIIFNKLFEDTEITKSEIEKFEKYLMSESDVNTIVDLLENYSYVEAKLLILDSIYKIFPQNTLVLNKFALALEEDNDFTKAEELLEKSLALNSEDPAVIFYLISIYLKSEQFNKIPNLIRIAEENFMNEPVVLQRIEILKDKLRQFIK